MTIEVRTRPEYAKMSFEHLVIQVEVTDIDDAPQMQNPRGNVQAVVTGRAKSPGYTFTRLENDNDGGFIIIFNEQTLEEFYLAHKLVIERTKNNGTN